MKKNLMHIFVAILILSSAFPTFSVSALSNPRIIEPEPQILRNEHVRLESELTEEVKLRLQNRTELIEERVQGAPTAEQIAQTQALVQSFDCTVTDVPVDCEALVALYNSTNGASWTNRDNWLTDSTVGNWYGVTVTSSSVSRIVLVDNLLSGIIPAELGNLTNLQTLDLTLNDLSGNIPPQLGNLTSLENLSLGANQLTGSIPTDLGKLTNLEFLDLSFNNLTGSIPSQLGNMKSLVELWLGFNQLTGNIPTEFGSLTNLTDLVLSDNPLSGSIPLSFVDLDSLVVFYFDATHLCAPTGDEEFQTWKDTVADWQGTIFICISTSYCADVSEIQLVQCEALVALYNSTSGPEWGGISDPWFTTTAVSSWKGVTITGSNVTGLNLSGNNLTGSIPPELGNLINLQTLDLYINHLTGGIPPELGNLTLLIHLYLDDNLLTGTIPPELDKLIILESLFLAQNQLTGNIPPELGNMTNLLYLFLEGNQLSGSIPAELGEMSNLRTLGLANNQLIGGIPIELHKLTNLAYLSLSQNQLAGSIPLSFVNLAYLVDFHFTDTHLCEPADETFQTLMDDPVLNWFGTDLPCHKPVAMADEYSTPEDSELIVTAIEGVLVNDTDADGDALSAELVSTVADGSLVLVADGSFTYNPNPDFYGEDSFRYKVFDSVEYSEVITVTIMVNQGSYSIYLPFMIK